MVELGQIHDFARVYFQPLHCLPNIYKHFGLQWQTLDWPSTFLVQNKQRGHEMSSDRQVFRPVPLVNEQKNELCDHGCSAS